MSLDNPDTASLHERRLRDTVVAEGYDQFTFLTQGAINRQFEMLWQKEGRFRNIDITINPRMGDLMKRFNISQGGFAGTMKATLAPPRIELIMFRMHCFAILHLTLTHGSYSWRTESGAIQLMMIQNWHMGLPVSFDNVKNNEYFPPSIKAKINKNGVYSAQQLLFHLAAASTTLGYCKKRSNIPDDCHTGPNCKNYFLFYIYKYLHSFDDLFDEYHARRSNVISAREDIYPVPTARTFQNYPFLSFPGVSLGSNECLDDDRNALVFLEVFNNRPLPTTPELIISKPWVVPPSDGTVCLPHRVFFYDYLLPKLASANIVCLVRVVPMINPDGRFMYNWVSGFEADAAYNPEFWDWVPAESEPLRKVWIWNSGVSSYGFEDRAGNYNRLSAQSSNWIGAVLGSSPMTIEIGGTVEMRVDTTNTAYEHRKYSSTLDWSAQLECIPMEGGISFTINYDTPIVKQLIPSDKNLLLDYPMNYSHETADFLNSTQRITMALYEMGQKFSDGSWKCVFSCGLDCELSRPVLNHRGDLLVDLTMRDIRDTNT